MANLVPTVIAYNVPLVKHAFSKTDSNTVPLPCGFCRLYQDIWYALPPSQPPMWAPVVDTMDTMEHRSCQ